MMGSSSSWSAPTSGSVMGSSLSSSAPEVGRGISSLSTTPWPAATSGQSLGFSFPPAQTTLGTILPPFAVPFGSTSGSWAPPFGVSHTHYSPSSSGSVSQKGSRVYDYTQTADAENLNCHMQSISAMAAYKSKSHEELRHEDYQRGNKGTDSQQKIIVTSAPILHMPVSTSAAAPANLTSSSPRDSSLKPLTNFTTQLSAPATVDQLFAQLQSLTGGSHFTANPFWHASTGSQSLFSSARLQPSLPGLNCTPQHPHVGFQKNTSNHFHCSHTASCTAHGGTLFGTAACTVPSTTSSTRPTTTSFGPSSFLSSNPHGVNVFNPYYSSSCCPASTGSACPENVSNNKATHTGQAYTASTKSYVSSQNLFPATSTQYGGDVDEPKNTIDLVLPSNIRLVRIRFSSRNDGTESLASKVHSVGFHDDKSSATAVSFSIHPGVNQELTIKSLEQPAKGHTGKQSSSTGGSRPDDLIGCSKVCNSAAGPPSSGINENQEKNSTDVHQTQKSPLAAPSCNVVTESVLPRLYNADYYTMPSIVELAVRESDEPGYCSHVKDFTVGRHGYGSVKFDGETDVRKLDIASIVEFNEHEILVYRDESKTPPVGQELNKPAEVTLLNVKCVDQKTRLEFTEGPAVDRYKEILVQWTKEHDAEFVSFDAAKGEWKFRVKNFNM